MDAGVEAAVCCPSTNSSIITTLIFVEHRVFIVWEYHEDMAANSSETDNPCLEYVLFFLPDTLTSLLSSYSNCSKCDSSCLKVFYLLWAFKQLFCG